MLEPLNCDAIIREHQRAEADAYFQRLYLYFRWRPWEVVPDGRSPLSAMCSDRSSEPREET